MCRAGLMVGMLLVCQILCASDWRFCGSTKGGSTQEILFYDADTVTTTGPVVRFWVKSISATWMDGFQKRDKKRFNELIASSARLVHDGYEPAFYKIPSMQSLRKEGKDSIGQFAAAIMYERIANEPNTRLRTRICYEINLTQRMARAIDGTVFEKNGNRMPSRGDTSTDWALIAPDTQAAWWLEYFSLNK